MHRLIPIILASLSLSGCHKADKRAVPAREQSPSSQPGSGRELPAMNQPGSGRKLLDRAERELARALIARGVGGVEGPPSIPGVIAETSERGDKTLVQFRILNFDMNGSQVPGLGQPFFVPYTFDAIEHMAAHADGPAGVVATVYGLMRRGEVAVEPIVVYLVTRPGKRARTWVEGIDRELEATKRDLLTKRTSEVAADDVERLDALSIVFPRSGQPVNAFDLPMPAEWLAAMLLTGRPLPIPDVVQRIWPDTQVP